MKITDWQMSLKDSITSLQELCHVVGIESTDLINDARAAKDFPLRVPREFAARIEKNNPKDPLLLQVLPRSLELQIVPGYGQDPVGDQAANPLSGLLHKYHGRVLLIVSGGCAVNCRYCFRRHFPYQENLPGKKGWQQALDYVAQDNSIDEVILSGGDPLTVKDREFVWLLKNIEAIDHVKRLRIHTRLPIMIPSRITQEFLTALSQSRLQAVLVIHCNHPNEIDQEVADALRRCQQQGICVLNQAVLLKDINDNADTLIHLNKKLFACGVLPYYLHLLDKVAGAAHFDVSEAQALKVMEQLREALPGYLLPRLVREEKGRPYKLSVQ